MVATCIVGVYLMASRVLPLLRRQTVVCGLAYGALAVGLLGVLFMVTGFAMPTFPHDVLHYAEGFFGGGGGHH